jgi:hypothetical protein
MGKREKLYQILLGTLLMQFSIGVQKQEEHFTKKKFSIKYNKKRRGTLSDTILF